MSNISLLVNTGTWYELSEFIPSSANSCLNSYISISIYSHHVSQITKLIHQLQVCIDTNIYTCSSSNSYCIYTPSTNKWLHRFARAIELLPMPLPQRQRGQLAAFCIFFCRSPLIITFVIFVFTQMPLLSMLTFSSLSLLVRWCLISPITTKSSTYNNSHGNVTPNCLDNASMTVKHNIQWNIFSSIKCPTTSAVSLEYTAITSEHATSMTIDQCTAAERKWQRIQSYYCKPISAIWCQRCALLHC